MAMNVGWLRGAEGLVLKSVVRIFLFREMY